MPTSQVARDETTAQGARAPSPKFTPLWRPTVEAIIDAVAAAAGVTTPMIIGDTKGRDEVRARWAVIDIALRHSGRSQRHIAHKLHKDHSTILNARARIGQLRAEGGEALQAFERIVERAEMRLTSGAAPEPRPPACAGSVGTTTPDPVPAPPAETAETVPDFDGETRRAILAWRARGASYWTIARRLDLPADYVADVLGIVRYPRAGI